MVKSTFKSHVIIDKSFEDGRLELTNNRAERNIKELVIGRKNWLHSTSLEGARTSVQGIERGVYVVDKIQFNQVIEEFIKVNNLMTHIQKRPIRITNDLKLSTSMIHLIDVIGNYPETSITELADRLGVTKGAVSQQIPTLEKMNLISI
ncbi:hypothetical protein EfmJHP36_21400 [Enterococcus faecium]|nr:hypothetical protein EfmJHP36_21400 [Enterococcus faecium]